MKKHPANTSSRKRLNKLCKDSALDLSRFGLDKTSTAKTEREIKEDEQKSARKKLFTEVRKKIENLSK